MSLIERSRNERGDGTLLASASLSDRYQEQPKKSSMTQIVQMPGGRAKRSVLVYRINVAQSCGLLEEHIKTYNQTAKTKIKAVHFALAKKLIELYARRRQAKIAVAAGEGGSREAGLASVSVADGEGTRVGQVR